MTDAWKELTQDPAAGGEAYNPPTREPVADAPATNAWAEMTRPQYELRATDTPVGRGIIERPELAAPNLVIARSSLAVDPKDQIKRYAAHFNTPESYFGVVDGEIVRWVPEENAFAKVVPTIGGQESIGGKIKAGISQTAAGAGPALPGVAATVAGTITGPSGASIPIAAVTAGLTDWARQAVDKVLAGEPAVPFAGAEYDYLNMFGHAGLAAGGQGIAVGLNSWLTRNPMGIEAFDRLNALDKVEQAKWAALEGEAMARGVSLSAGQKTGLRSLMAKERQLSRYPETADMMQRFRDNQWKAEIPQAAYGEFSKVAPVMGREDMISSFRAGADDVVQQTLAARAEQAKVAYGAAYDAHPALDSPTLRNLWGRDVVREAIGKARASANARGELLGPVDAELTDLARELSAAGKMEAPRGGIAKGLSLNTWDRVKRALDDIIGESVSPQTGKLTDYGSSVLAAKQTLVRELDKLTGGPAGLYAKARLGYGESSEIVDQVLEGGVGFIQKMAGPDRVSMVTRVFSGRNVLPEEIARTRDLFAKAGHEGAWNNGVVAHLAQLLDDSIKSAGMSGNVPGQLYSRLGRDALQHDSIIAAIGPAKAKSFEKFTDVLFAASRSLPEGSPTATDLLPQAGAVSGRLKVAGQLLSPETYFRGANAVIEGLEKLREPGARIRLADYLLTEKGAKEIQRFHTTTKLTQRSIIGAAQVLANAGVIVSGGRTPADFEAPIAGQTPSQIPAR
jgi:hypothetical protein